MANPNIVAIGDEQTTAIVGNSFSSGTLMFQINYDETAGRIRLTVVPAGSQEVVFTP